MAKPLGTPPIIDTAKLQGIEPEPRDHKPGVIPDVPVEDGTNPVTNLPDEMMQDAVTPKTVTEAPKIIGAPPNDPPPAGKPKGRMIECEVLQDIWPRTRPPGMPDDREYRVRSGETVKLAEEEAFDFAESGHVRRKKG